MYSPSMLEDGITVQRFDASEWEDEVWDERDYQYTGDTLSEQIADAPAYYYVMSVFRDGSGYEEVHHRDRRISRKSIRHGQMHGPYTRYKYTPDGREWLWTRDMYEDGVAVGPYVQFTEEDSLEMEELHKRMEEHWYRAYSVKLSTPSS